MTCFEAIYDIGHFTHSYAYARFEPYVKSKKVKSNQPWHRFKDLHATNWQGWRHRDHRLGKEATCEVLAIIIFLQKEVNEKLIWLTILWGTNKYLNLIYINDR